MAIFKIKKNDYPTLWDITNVIGYVTRTTATVPELICTHGIYLSTPDSMANQLFSTKTLCGQTTGRQLYHVILSFTEKETYDYAQILDIVRAFVSLPDLYGHQSIAAIHTDKDTPDAHILFNSVNSFTGLKTDLTSLGFWRKQQDLLADYMLDTYEYSIYYKILYD